VYSIDTDLSALLQPLQKSRHNGRVRAQIPYGFAGLSGGYAFIDMAQGRMVACYLVNAQKQLILSGTEAVDVISSIGILHWIVGQETQQTNMHLPAVRPNTSGPQYTHPNLPAIQPYSPNTTQHSNPRIPAIQPYPPNQQRHTFGLNNPPGPRNYHFSTFVAERLVYIDSNLLAGLNRRLRRVLVLVNGQRSVIKIASILHPHDDGQQEIFSCLQQLAKMKIIVIRED
jgi:hypothetical protein